MEIRSKLVNDSVLVVQPRIDCLDASNVGVFREKIYALIEIRSDVICDLGQINFVDSSGLGVLISCQKRLRAAGGSFRVCGLTATVKTLFDLMRMERVFDIHVSLNEALAVHNSQTKI